MTVDMYMYVHVCTCTYYRLSLSLALVNVLLISPLGVVLAPLIAHKPGQCSGLLILDAKSFTEIARAYSPAHVKVAMTFHGEFDKTHV